MNDNERLQLALAVTEREGICLRARNSRRRRILRARAAKGELLAVRDDMFVRPEYWNGLTYRERIMHQLRTAARMHPNAAFAQISAAAIWGLNETYRMHDRIHLATDLQSHCRDRRYYAFHFMPKVEAEQHEGLNVTGLLQTVFDCARTLDFPQALAICDAAMRIHGVVRHALEVFVEGRRGYKGVAAARNVVAHGDARSENGGESIVRGLLIEWGYVTPLLQQWIQDPVTGRWYRVDFLWVLPTGEMIVLELDGREKYVNPDMLAGGDGIDAVLAEKERESNIRLRGGIRFVRATYREFELEPEKVRFKLDLAGVPKL